MTDVQTLEESLSRNPHARMPAVEMYIGEGEGTWIPAHDYVKSLSCSLSVNEAFTAKIEFYDASWEYIENLLLANGIHGRIRFRFGWRLSGGNDLFTPWFEHVIYRYSPAFDITGLTVNVETMTASTFNAVPGGERVSTDDVQQQRTGSIESGNKTLWYYTGTEDVAPIGAAVIFGFGYGYSPPRWSSIAKRMADLGGFNGGGNAVDDDGNPCIEDTVDHPQMDAITQEVPDLELLRRLATEAPYAAYCLSAAGRRGGYVAWVDVRNRLNFRPPPTRSQASKSIPHFQFNRNMRGRVKSFEVQDNDWAIKALGGGVGGSRVAADTTDADNPDVDESEDSQTANVWGIEGEYIPSGAEGEERVPLFTTEARTVAEAQALARSRYMLHAQYMFRASMTILGDPTLTALNKFVYVRIMRNDAKPHYLSGVYRVVGIEHELGVGEYDTTLQLLRHAVMAKDLKLSGVGLDIGATEAAAVRQQQQQSGRVTFANRRIAREE